MGSPRRYRPHLRCPDCRQHRSMCLCALLPRIETRTRVVLIIHQLEACKPTNTGAIAARCLTNSAIVYRGRPFGAGAAQADADAEADAAAAVAGAVAGPEPAPATLTAAPLWSEGAQPLLLYPHPEATPLEAWRGSPSSLTLLVPDGTWRQAGRTRARMGRGVPCVALPEALAAGTRMRASAHPDRLATLEAVALALGILEGPAVEDALMRVFRTMTERTLWTKGRLAADAVTGGIPEGARPHDPLGGEDR